MATSQLSLPVDPDIKVPEAVRRAAAKAESFYAANPPADPAQPVVPAREQPAPEPAINPAQVPVQVQTQAPPPPPTQAPPPPPTQAPAPQEPPNFEHQYNSMKGRYDASQRTIGSLQEQMSQMGDELMRVQQVLTNPNINRNPSLSPDIKPAYITDEDVKNYGADLIDVTKRAALEAVAPTLTALQQENQRLNQQVSQQRTQGIYERLDESMPDWRQVNEDPRWRQWLRLRDFNSSPVRQEQLNMAMRAADAPRVLAFFKRFQDEEAATGQTSVSQPPQPQSEPRVAAIPLASLASPGRLNPAPGNTQAPDAKPIWSHAEIKNFYNAVRTNYFAGRDADKARIEADIFAAQREGRVR